MLVVSLCQRASGSHSLGGTPYHRNETLELYAIPTNEPSVTTTCGWAISGTEIISSRSIIPAYVAAGSSHSRVRKGGKCPSECSARSRQTNGPNDGRPRPRRPGAAHTHEDKRWGCSSTWRQSDKLSP